MVKEIEGLKADNSRIEDEILNIMMELDVMMVQKFVIQVNQVYVLKVHEHVQMDNGVFVCLIMILQQKFVEMV